MEDEHIYKSHNKSLLLYHLVFPAKYRRKIFTDAVEKSLRDVSQPGSRSCQAANGIIESEATGYAGLGLDCAEVPAILWHKPTENQKKTDIF